MDPRWLFPLLAAAFTLAAALRWLRRRRRTDAAVRTWLLLALIFGVVAAWLHWNAIAQASDFRSLLGR